MKPDRGPICLFATPAELGTAAAREGSVLIPGHVFQRMLEALN